MYYRNVNDDDDDSNGNNAKNGNMREKSVGDKNRKISGGQIVKGLLCQGLESHCVNYFY